MVNEPFSHLTASDLSKEAKRIGDISGCKTTILEKKEIVDLKMGGLLAVNKGSLDDPTFTIMEWKPKNHKNLPTGYPPLPRAAQPDRGHREAQGQGREPGPQQI